MMGRCCSSIPSSNPSELKPFQIINGLQQLAEARRFKVMLSFNCKNPIVLLLFSNDAHFDILVLISIIHLKILHFQPSSVGFNVVCLIAIGSFSDINFLPDNQHLIYWINASMTEGGLFIKCKLVVEVCCYMILGLKLIKFG